MEICFWNALTGKQITAAAASGLTEVVFGPKNNPLNFGDDPDRSPVYDRDYDPDQVAEVCRLWLIV